MNLESYECFSFNSLNGLDGHNDITQISISSFLRDHYKDWHYYNDWNCHLNNCKLLLKMGCLSKLKIDLLFAKQSIATDNQPKIPAPLHHNLIASIRLFFIQFLPNWRFLPVATGIALSSESSSFHPSIIIITAKVCLCVFSIPLNGVKIESNRLRLSAVHLLIDQCSQHSYPVMDVVRGNKFYWENLVIEFKSIPSTYIHKVISFWNPGNFFWESF